MDFWQFRYDNAMGKPIAFAKKIFNESPPQADNEGLAAKAFMEAILTKFSNCKIEKHAGAYGVQEYKITNSEGFWINIGVDQAIVEI